MLEQINILDIIKLFLRNWWKIATTAILGAVIAFFVTVYGMTPIYTSRGSLYVNNNNTTISQNVNLSDLATAQQLAYTYVELLSSDTFMSQVLSYSQLPYTAAQLKGMVSMAPLNETEIIEIKAVSYYPEHSQAIVDSVLKNAQDEIMRVIQAGSITVVDQATLPLSPSSPSKKRNVAIGFMLGALFTMFILFIVDVFDTRIKSEKDLRKVREFPLLGVIPQIQATIVEESKDVNSK